MTIQLSERRGGMRVVGSGGGGKGGGSSRTPVEQPDSLHNIAYAALLDVISNGEVYGPAYRLQPLRCVFLDGTPIQNEDGSLNVNNVQVEIRNGTQDQEHIAGFPASSNVIAVGVEVKTTQSWSQLITNENLSAVRVTLQWPQLMRAIESGNKAGDRVGYKIEYAIDLAVGSGSFENVLTTSVDGKSVGGYSRTHRLDLPSSSGGWTVRVRRITAEANNTAILEKMMLMNYAEVIDGKFRYPMTALVGIKIDASQFQSIPARAYLWRGQIISVPSNYDPETRIYTGVWDGTFKRAWSNNPAWIFYDILTSKLYGLGDRVDASMIDRYALYQIGAYCDQLVSDGQGGLEPRFTCNLYLQRQADALKVINDLASVFRGMAYWANGQVVAVADAPSDPVFTYTNAKVVDGRFEYTGSDISTRKTVALVSWNDPSDFHRPKVEVVEDDEGILRYGIRKTEVTAIGCSSRGQAQRVGLYHLYTSRMETGGVGFSVGLEGVVPQPGSIVKVADEHRAGRSIGGLVRQASKTTVTVDRDHPIQTGNSLTVNLPNGSTESRPVTLVSDRVITVYPAFSAAPTEDASWAVDADDLVTQQIRVISVKERDDGIVYDVAGLFHHPGKFSAIDSGVRLDPLPVSVVPPRAQLAPSNVRISEHATFHQGTTRHNAEITWDAPENAVSYDVQWRRDSGDWVQMPRTGTLLAEIPNVFSGDYVVRVRGFNGLDVPSLWAYSPLTTLAGLVGEPAKVAVFTATGEFMAIRLDWGYPDTPNIIEKVEIRGSLSNSFSDSYLVTVVSYPATSYMLYGLGYSTELWFWVRLIDKNGTAGQWHPAASGAGLFGKPNQDPATLLQHLEGRLEAGHFAPGLISEIKVGITDDVMRDIVGDLAGDDVLDQKWYAGDDGRSFVGTVTTTSAFNEGDYREAKRTLSLAAQTEGNLAVIRQELKVTSDLTRATATSMSTMSVKVAVMESTVQESSEAIVGLDGALRASWQAKLAVREDGRVVQTGVALGASISPDGTSRSEFIVMANTVAFLTSRNGKLHSPFIFDVENDTAFFNMLFVKTASITDAMVESLNAKKIVAGTMSADRIEAESFFAKLASIDSAYIKKANIGEAEVDTLHLKNGAVSAGNAVPLNLYFGAGSGSNSASITFNLPAEGSALMSFEYAARSDASQIVVADYVRLYLDGVELSRVPVINYSSSEYDNTKSGSAIRTKIPPGPHTLSLVFPRPSGSAVSVTGNLALISFLR